MYLLQRIVYSLRSPDRLGRQQITMVGIEPAEIKTGIGLSAAVEASVGFAASFARMTITKILSAA